MNQAFRVSPFCLVSWLGISALLMSPALAQVNGPGPSPSTLFDTVLNLPGDEAVVTGMDGESIGGVTGQTTQLNVTGYRGKVVGNRFDALAGSEVNISGGAVGYLFSAWGGSEVNMSGGTVTDGFRAIDGSQVNISGGTLKDLTAHSGSEVNISGGTFEESSYSFIAASGSEVNISGGTFGWQFSAFPGSDVELVGGEFRLNGVDFSGGTISLDEGDLFTGTLADGSAFIFTDIGYPIDRLTNVSLTAGALPAADLEPIVLTSAQNSNLSGLRAGQTLTLRGGSLRDYFTVVGATLNVVSGFAVGHVEVANSEVNISGGNVGRNFRAFTGSEVNISGRGTVGDISDAFSSQVNISGGTVGDGFDVESCEVNITGGTVGDRFGLDASVVNISGGTVGHTFGYVSGDSCEVNITGGTVGDFFRLRNGSVVNISDGTVGRYFGGGARVNISGDAVVGSLSSSGGDANITGGTVGDGSRAIFTSVVNISGGNVGNGFYTNDGSSVNITGGAVGSNFSAEGGSVVTISGGNVSSNFSAEDGSVVNISGGNVGEGFRAFPDSAVNIRGSVFFIDGEELETDGIAVLPPVADWTTGAPGGTPGGAVSFDGTGVLATGISANFVGNDRTDGALDYTVSAWINSSDVDGAGNAADDRWWFGTSSQGIYLGIFDSNRLWHGHWGASTSGTAVVPADTWVHITYTFDADGGTLGTGEVTIYLNGVSEGSFDSSAPNRQGTDLIIGGRNGRPSWVGSIDDLAIFTSALSAADVATLAADTTQAVSLGAAAYYNFEDTQAGMTAANLVSVATSGLIGTDGSPALQELDLMPEAFIITDRDVTLSGLLADGEQFSFALNSDSSSDNDFFDPDAMLTVTLVSPVLLGDVNQDGVVDFSDIPAFIAALIAGEFQAEADCDQSGIVDFADIPAFIQLLIAS